MGKNIILKKHISVLRKKQGSYIVEASLSLPIFIICVVSLALIVKIITVCENIGFVSACEMRNIDLMAYKAETSLSLCGVFVKESVMDENPEISDFDIIKFRCLYSYKGIDDLIGLKTRTVFKVENPVGIYGNIVFTQSLLTRGFTGTEKPIDPLEEKEFTDRQKSHPVVIFPKYGERFHTQSCWYVTEYNDGKAYKLQLEMEDAKKMGYTPCMVCGGVLDESSDSKS